MSQPSMAEAAKIRDVAARHAYVFDNGLSSPDFFDLEKRMKSEEFGLLRERIQPHENVLEIGCFTGLNLLALHRLGHRGFLVGLDFVENAVKWMSDQNSEVFGCVAQFPECPDGAIPRASWDTIICFDVLEHQLNVGRFLAEASQIVTPSGRVFFLVPIEKEFYDCGHVAFFPDAECLRNVLDYYFEVEEIFELKTCRKLFASCRRRA